MKHGLGPRSFGGFRDNGRLMSIERAEQLKRELTDKWVVVAEKTPELRRFAALTGKVKTVNMNCRALVQFDGPEDISWYDIDPEFLTVVDGPRAKAVVEEKAAPKAEKTVAPASTANTGTTSGSPLDKIRAASKPAAPASGGSPLDKIRAAAKPATPSAGGSPLDKIRASSKPAPVAAEDSAPESVAEAPKPAPAEPATPKPAATGSPLDQIRARGAFKG